jgi:hypothetical protein
MDAVRGLQDRGRGWARDGAGQGPVEVPGPLVLLQTSALARSSSIRTFA